MTPVPEPDAPPDPPNDVGSVPASALSSRLYAGSSFAYFASSFFTPTDANRTVILRSSLCCFDAHHRADAELRMADAHARACTPGRPTDPRPRSDTSASVLARPAAAAAAVRVGAELVVAVAERTLVGGVRRRRDPLHELGRNLVEKARRLGPLVLAEHAPARGARQDQVRLRPGHADVAQPPLFLDAPPRPRRRASAGTSPSSSPAMTTSGNSRPFAACIVISQTRASRVPDSSSASERSDSRSTNPPSEASARAPRSRARPTRAPSRFSIRSLASSLFSSRSVLQVAGLIEHLAEQRSRPASWRAACARLTIRSRNDAQRRDRARRQPALVDGVNRASPRATARRRPRRARRPAAAARRRRTPPDRSPAAHPSRPCRRLAPAR